MPEKNWIQFLNSSFEFNFFGLRINSEHAQTALTLIGPAFLVDKEVRGGGKLYPPYVSQEPLNRSTWNFTWVLFWLITTHKKNLGWRRRRRCPPGAPKLEKLEISEIFNKFCALSSSAACGWNFSMRPVSFERWDSRLKMRWTPLTTISDGKVPKNRFENFKKTKFQKKFSTCFFDQFFF